MPLYDIDYHDPYSVYDEPIIPTSGFWLKCCFAAFVGIATACLFLF